LLIALLLGKRKPQERLEGLSIEEIEAYLKKLKKMR
jgi:hypothetical protein